MHHPVMQRHTSLQGLHKMAPDPQTRTVTRTNRTNRRSMLLQTLCYKEDEAAVMCSNQASPVHIIMMLNWVIKWTSDRPRVCLYWEEVKHFHFLSLGLRTSDGTWRRTTTELKVNANRLIQYKSHQGCRSMEQIIHQNQQLTEMKRSSLWSESLTAAGRDAHRQSNRPRQERWFIFELFSSLNASVGVQMNQAVNLNLNYWSFVFMHNMPISLKYQPWRRHFVNQVYLKAWGSCTAPSDWWFVSTGSVCVGVYCRYMILLHMKVHIHIYILTGCSALCWGNSLHLAWYSVAAPEKTRAQVWRAHLWRLCQLAVTPDPDPGQVNSCLVGMKTCSHMALHWISLSCRSSFSTS